MKSRTLLISSHLLVLIIGLLLAHHSQKAAVVNEEDASTPSKSHASGATSHHDMAVARRKTSHRRGRSAHRSRFRRAWDALPDQKLSKHDRLEAQRKILAEWAEVDLASAMEMALTVPWDDGSSREGFGVGPMAAIFAKFFIEKPEKSWALINSGKFGVGASLFRSTWYESVAKKNPLVLASILTECSWRDLNKVLHLIKNNSNNPETQTQVFELLATLPEDLLTPEQMMRFMKTMTPEEIHSRLTEMDDFSGREAKILSLYLALSQTKALKEAGNAGQVTEIVANNLALLPDDVHGEFIHKTLIQMLPAGKTPQGAKQTLALVDLLIEGERWDLLNRFDTWRKVKDLSGISNKDRAAWAVNLPQRKETTELFHRSIDHYISNNMKESWDWIQSFPSGRWRDRALAEYSQQALNSHRDYEASRRALDQISDPKYRATAEGWRQPWARKKDKP